MASEYSPVPPFAFWDFAVGKDKTIGGLVLYGKEQGQLAGDLIKKIFEQGQKPEEISPVTARGGRYLFSKSQIEKHHIVLPDEIARVCAYVE